MAKFWETKDLRRMVASYMPKCQRQFLPDIPQEGIRARCIQLACR